MPGARLRRRPRLRRLRRRVVRPGAVRNVVEHARFRLFEPRLEAVEADHCVGDGAVVEGWVGAWVVVQLSVTVTVWGCGGTGPEA